MTAHQIKTVELDMNFHDHDGVGILHQRIQEFCATKLPQFLAGIFDDAVESDSVLHVDRLDLDLGGLSYENLEEDFLENLEGKLSDFFQNTSHIRKQIYPRTEGHRQEGSTGKVTIKERNQEVLKQYFLQGTVPWNSSGFHLATELKKYLKRLERDHFEKKWLQKQLKQNSLLRERFIFHLHDEELNQLVSLLWGVKMFQGSSSSMAEILAQTSEVLSAKLPVHEIKAAFWMAVIDLVDGGGEPSNLHNELTKARDKTNSRTSQGVSTKIEVDHKGKADAELHKKSSVHADVDLLKKIILGEISSSVLAISNPSELLEMMQVWLTTDVEARVWLQEKLSSDKHILGRVLELFPDPQMVAFFLLLHGSADVAPFREYGVSFFEKLSGFLAKQDTNRSKRSLIWQKIFKQPRLELSAPDAPSLPILIDEISTIFGLASQQVLKALLPSTELGDAVLDTFNRAPNSANTEDMRRVIQGEISPSALAISNPNELLEMMQVWLTTDVEARVWLQEKLSSDPHILGRVLEFFPDPQMVAFFFLVHGRAGGEDLKKYRGLFFQNLSGFLAGQGATLSQRILVWQNIFESMHAGHFLTDKKSMPVLVDEISEIFKVSSQEVVDALLSPSLLSGLDSLQRNILSKSENILELQKTIPREISSGDAGVVSEDVLPEKIKAWLASDSEGQGATPANITDIGKVDSPSSSDLTGQKGSLAEILIRDTEANVQAARDKSLSRDESMQPAQLSCEELHINNAGVVLLAPFLGNLFRKLDYLENDEFKSREHTFRALHLIQYLATGEEVFFEYELPLNKILCGVPIYLPVPVEMELKKNEKQEAENMLKAAISHWRVLKNTSIHGLQTTFLQRKGILTQGDKQWNLRVERKTLDVLMDTMPWSFSIIKLGWMDTMITVEW